ncbi:MAG: NTP transferase domain-containing protein [Longimicrobiales bacterium]
MNTISMDVGARQARRPHVGGLATHLRKPVIALVMAGGGPRPEFGSRAPGFRALLPVGGRPIVSWILDALEASAVERVFVFHDAACDMPSLVAAGAKTVFVPRPGDRGAFVDGVRHALEATVGACGLAAVRRSRLLALPCDLPFVTAETLDRLLERSDALEFDFAYTAVSRDLLARRFPDRPFRAYPAADLGGFYALQTPSLIDGACFGLADAGSRLTFGDWSGEEAERLLDSIGALRRGRGAFLQVPRALHELVLRRLAASGRRRPAAGLLLRTLTGRLRTTDLDRLAWAAFRVRTLCIDSEAPELSADVDRPADLASYGVVDGRTS